MHRPHFFIVLLTTLLLLGVSPAQLRTTNLDRLLDALHDQDYKVRLQAALILARLKDQRSVPALITALDDANALVRGMAAHALGLIGDARAIVPLTKHLKDPSPLARKRIRYALRQIRQAKKTPLKHSSVLLRLASVSDSTRRERAYIPILRRLWIARIEQSPGIKLTSARQPSSRQKLFELTSTLTKLSLQRMGTQLEVTCQISLVLGDHNGSIVMMTTGGASVQMNSRQRKMSRIIELKTKALEEAVNSVHENLMRFLASR